ncbi:hypothetical protein VTG60DRAFT_2722 [Thermothelomyces hinnuleus]
MEFLVAPSPRSVGSWEEVEPTRLCPWDIRAHIRDPNTGCPATNSRRPGGGDGILERSPWVPPRDLAPHPSGDRPETLERR